MPSVPAIVTPVASVAATVSVDDAPALIDAGAAVMLTVGCAAGSVPAVEPHPTKISRATGRARPLQVLPLLRKKD